MVPMANTSGLHDHWDSHSCIFGAIQTVRKDIILTQSYVMKHVSLEKILCRSFYFFFLFVPSLVVDLSDDATTMLSSIFWSDVA